MADPAIRFLLEELASLARGSNFSGYDEVKDNLKEWQRVLQYLDGKKSKEASVHNMERDIRDLVYRIEDLADVMLIFREQSTFGKIKDEIFQGFYSSLRERNSEIREINCQLTDTAKILENLDMLTISHIEDDRYDLETENQERITRNPDAGKKDEYAVGEEEDIWKLNTLVCDEHSPVICIYGCDGIGKTTLARKVYNDNNVGLIFQGLAWLDVDKVISITDAFQDLLKQLSEPGGNEMLMSNVNCATQLRNLLRVRKCLIVLDGIKSVDDWEEWCQVFPSEGSHSKILCTTVVEEVANNVGRDGTHSMKPLTARDSWFLFQRIAFSGDHAEVNAQKNLIGMEILEKCKGIPSAIISIGELLATKHSEVEWEEVLKDPESFSSVQQSGKEKPNLALNFDKLPYDLKSNYIYLFLFRDSEVEVEHLYPLWLAEEMILISPGNNETVMDVAERCLSKLVEHNVVKVQEEEGPLLRKFRSCRVHEPMKHHCSQKGKEYFFKDLTLGPTTTIEGDSSMFLISGNPVRRLALYLIQHDHKVKGPLYRKVAKHLLYFQKMKKAKHLRSLLLFPHDLVKMDWPQGIIDFTEFEMLRTLTFERFDFQGRGLPEGITMLIYLRYLSFRGCILKKLPSSLCNLTFLLILDLRVDSSIQIIIPDVLGKLKKLKHLYLPLLFRTSTGAKLHLRKLKELEILENFDARMCNAADIRHMEKLQHLSVNVDENLEDLKQIVQCMNEIPVVERSLHLSITVKNIDCYTEERHWVFRKLLNCKILHSIHMDGHLGQIPWKDEITESLTEVVLVGSQLKEDPMTTLDKLPKLQVLGLQDDAFVGKEMKCSGSGFPELKCLQLVALGLVETWKVENEAMPKLSVLVLKNCRHLDLQKIPDGFRCRVPCITFEAGSSSTHI